MEDYVNRPDKISAADISAICQEVSPNHRFFCCSIQSHVHACNAKQLHHCYGLTITLCPVDGHF